MRDRLDHTHPTSGGKVMMVWRIVCLHAILMISSSAWCQQQTTPAQEETLGRLFYTAQQRAALDANVRSVEKKPQKPIVLPPAVTLTGIVTRSDGERTVWIDGKAYHRRDTGDIRVTTRANDPAQAEVKVRGVRERLPMRVGQSLDPASGQTFERYESAPVSTHSRARREPTNEIGAETASNPSSTP